MLLVAGAAVMAGTVSGCRTIDGGAPEPGGLHADDLAFFRRVGRGALPPGIDDAPFAAFFSFDRWEPGRSFATTLVPDLFGSIDRIDRGFVFLDGSHRVAIVETSVARIAASIALNAAGWRRDGWGVWRSADSGTTVFLEADRTWYIFTGTAAAAPLVVGGSEGILRLQRIATVDASPGLSVATAGIVRFPNLAGVPTEFQPLTMAFTVSNESEVEARFAFRDPRSARVALVPFRLRGERALGAYGFTPTEGFDIQRDGGEIVVTGVVVEALMFPVGDTSRDYRGVE